MHNCVSQGTIAYELLEQVPDLDAILVPISGGGMTSGIAIATKALSPKTKGITELICSKFMKTIFNVCFITWFKGFDWKQ